MTLLDGRISAPRKHVFFVEMPAKKGLCLAIFKKDFA
jgi:hypothetical protein